MLIPCPRPNTNSVELEDMGLVLIDADDEVVLIPHTWVSGVNSMAITLKLYDNTVMQIAASYGKKVYIFEPTPIAVDSSHVSMTFI